MEISEGIFFLTEWFIKLIKKTVVVDTDFYIPYCLP